MVPSSLAGAISGVWPTFKPLTPPFPLGPSLWSLDESPGPLFGFSGFLIHSNTTRISYASDS